MWKELAIIIYFLIDFWLLRILREVDLVPVKVLRPYPQYKSGRLGLVKTFILGFASSSPMF